MAANECKWLGGTSGAGTPLFVCTAAEALNLTTVGCEADGAVRYRLVNV